MRAVRPYAACDRCKAEEDVGKEGGLPQFWGRIEAESNTGLRFPKLCLDLCSDCIAELRQWVRSGKVNEGYKGGRSGVERIL